MHGSVNIKFIQFMSNAFFILAENLLFLRWHVRVALRQCILHSFSAATPHRRFISVLILTSCGSRRARASPTVHGTHGLEQPVARELHFAHDTV
jgi:hypothetical protein